jgi:DNA repair protein RadC
VSSPDIIFDFFVLNHGRVNASIVHPRDVFKRALLSNSTSILLIHNHPTGNTKPSKNDKKRTQRLVDGGEILGINVLDHLIIGDYNYYSFKENNLL